MVQQKYVRRSHARRAAVASLGPGLVEGRDFKIFEFPDDGFGYKENGFNKKSYKFQYYCSGKELRGLFDSKGDVNNDQ